MGVALVGLPENQTPNWQPTASATAPDLVEEFKQDMQIHREFIALGVTSNALIEMCNRHLYNHTDNEQLDIALTELLWKAHPDYLAHVFRCIAGLSETI